MGINPNIDEQSSQKGDIPVTGPTASENADIQVVKKQVSNWYHDNLSSSDLAKIAQMLDASSPTLPPPIVTAASFNDLFAIAATYNAASSGVESTNVLTAGLSGTAFLMQIDEEMHKITMSVLDQWNAQLQKEADETRARLNSPAYQAWLDQQRPDFIAQMEQISPANRDLAILNSSEFQKMVAALSPTDQLDLKQTSEQYRIKVGLSQGLDNYVNQVRDDPTKAQAAAFLAMSLVIGGPILLDLSSTGMVAATEALTPIIEMTNQINLLVPTSALAGELGFLGGLMMLGAMFGANGENVVESAAKQKKPVNLDTARKYAQIIINLIQNRGFENFVQTMVLGKLDGSDGSKNPMRMRLIKILQIVLASSALALVYKSQTKWIQGEEFLAMLRMPKEKGAIKMPEDKPEGTLVNLIRSYMFELKAQDVDYHTQVREALRLYFDRNPSMETLFEPSKILRELLSTDGVLANRLQTPT